MCGKQLYNTVAEMVRNLPQKHAVWDITNQTTANEIAMGLADAFAADNPGFDRQRFLTTCGF